MSNLKVRIENGEFYYESHEGDWITDGQLEYIKEYFVENIETIVDIPSVMLAFQQSEEGEVFIVTIPDPTVVIEKGGWSSHGWEPDYIYIDWENDTIVVEPIETPGQRDLIAFTIYIINCCMPSDVGHIEKLFKDFTDDLSSNHEHWTTKPCERCYVDTCYETADNILKAWENLHGRPR